MTITDCLHVLQGAEPALTFYQPLPPATTQELQRLEALVGALLPAELRELYEHSDGIAEYWRGKPGEEPRLDGYLVLPVAEAVEENQRARLKPQTVTEASLLIFARPYVDGCQFAYRMADLPAQAPPIYVWCPLEDELVKLADTLPEFLLGWVGGEIKF